MYGDQLRYNLLVALVIIDDATRKTWVYCIRQKSDVFDTFNKWKPLAENETGKRLKCLKSDKGGEYYSKDFDSPWNTTRKCCVRKD